MTIFDQSDLHTDPMVCSSTVGVPMKITMAEVMAELMAEEQSADTTTFDWSVPEDPRRHAAATHDGSMNIAQVARLLADDGMACAIVEDFRGTPRIHVGLGEVPARRSSFDEGSTRPVMVLAPKLVEDRMWLEATSPMDVACHVLFDVPAERDSEVTAALRSHYGYLTGRIEFDLDTEAWCDQAVEELIDEVALAAEDEPS